MGTVVSTLLGVLIILAASGLKLDREYQRGVIFRLGRYSAVRGPGLYWVIPVLDQKIQLDVRTRTVDIQAQETVTADSVTIRACHQLGKLGSAVSHPT